MYLMTLVTHAVTKMLVRVLWLKPSGVLLLRQYSVLVLWEKNRTKPSENFSTFTTGYIYLKCRSKIIN